LWSCIASPPPIAATLVYYDNVITVYPIQHQRNKHGEIDLHFVRESVVVGDICVLRVPETSRFTDIFTKKLPFSVFSKFWSSLNISSG
jgi:hypothetical protein